ncbi:MAG: hypothetical protein COU63_03220 [Candidatus Pacebacteria bacterium CG10_big_fil_rev_8_21_14_0_10_36_11]|nr:NAD-dependent epimerase/dehydratase family protein [Candidatus Pacearchaeota archaeon]OIP74435.1 MAG: hypothetical protein AUK08_01470 [Candidatus Pacebacteria bacterium CG2_30_36_39]PIR64999.1 MAG: hypothetical protein COU63_03220 [Candidatus Pacebacteria bacterium CG10_big_fil_rev_8_21_14_0_10_36_11]PJC42477.1 MAG: hypothetical protein CO040_04250 [Candidatus Pacebacteria bacterium CG_4_9_14_0_2_um_filter_36_8]
MKTNGNILITGGTGFVGTHLVQELIANNTPAELIHVTTLKIEPQVILDQLIPQTNFHEANLTKPNLVMELFELLKPEHIYNLASFSSPGLSLEKKSLVLDINTKIQLNVLEAMLNITPNAKLLSIGSGTEYAPSPSPLTETSPLGPRNPYAVSKVTQDMLASAYYASHNLNIVRTRSFNHIGEYQPKGFVIPDFVSQITQEIEKGLKKELRVGNIDVSRDFTDVKDVVKAYALLMEKGEAGEVYNIGSGRDVTLREILEKLQQLANKEFKIVADESKNRTGETDRVTADIAKIESLGWEPTIPLDTTLARIVQWWREQ